MRCQVEDGAVMRSREPGVKPAQELGAGPESRHPLVIDGCENGAADQDLPPGIAFAFRLADARDQSVLFDTQASEPFVECLKTDADFFGLRHCASFVGHSSMQVQCRDSVRQDRAVKSRDVGRGTPPAGRREVTNGLV
jgi:hypothetical protein